MLTMVSMAAVIGMIAMAGALTIMVLALNLSKGTAVVSIPLSQYSVLTTSSFREIAFSTSPIQAGILPSLIR